ncbi:MAG: hypothetical protein M3P24_07785 [Gemmatimonadota bacterium]|nr:hypothetical protein [Gemmatimonadota bacterium]
MLSTGIGALDDRLGGLVPGRHYLITGVPGSGKSSLVLHFVGAGIEAGERCAILTQDDPEDLLSQAEFLGYDLRPAAEEGRLAVLHYRPDFIHNLSRAVDPEQIVGELLSLLENDAPDRFAVDSILPFLQEGSASYEAMEALSRILRALQATTYLSVPGDVSDSAYWRFYNRIVNGAAGIFHLQVRDGPVRELSLRKLRQAAASTEPFLFVIHPGVGIVEHAAARPLAEVPPEMQRRVVVLNTTASIPEDLLAGLRQAYDVHSYDAVEQAFAELTLGRFGVLLLVIDPRDPESAFQLTRELRRVGNGAPILFLSSSNELRSSTRGRGLRAGGDDFLTDSMDLREFLQRVEVARSRGHRTNPVAVGAESLAIQPHGPDGEPLPIDDAELGRAVLHQVHHSSHPFFALVFLRPRAEWLDETWRILCDHVRVREGDLVAKLSDGRIGMYLHDINRRHVRELLTRVIQAHPQLAGVDGVEVYSFPSNRAEIVQWAERAEVLHAVEAE